MAIYLYWRTPVLDVVFSDWAQMFATAVFIAAVGVASWLAGKGL